MARELVTDELWEVIEPLLPEEPPKPKGGRPRIDDRQALTGIIFVLKSGIPWEMLPQEMGCGSGMSCRRRLEEWQEAGVWERLHQKLLERLGEADQIQVGGGKNALVDQPLPAAESALRAARGHPSSVPGSRMRSHLLALRSAVMLGALSSHLPGPSQ